MNQNWASWCRLCAKAPSNEEPFLDTSQLAIDFTELIQRCFQISHLEPLDNKPPKLCLACIGFLTKLKAFDDTCSRSDKLFIKIVCGDSNRTEEDPLELCIVRASHVGPQIVKEQSSSCTEIEVDLNEKITENIQIFKTEVYSDDSNGINAENFLPMKCKSNTEEAHLGEGSSELLQPKKLKMNNSHSDAEELHMNRLLNNEIESAPTANDVRHLQNDDLRVGQKYLSFEEARVAVDRYGTQSFNQYVVKSSVTLDAQVNKYPKGSAVLAGKELRYFVLEYRCVRGGNYKKLGTERKTSTIKQGCPSRIRFKLSECSRYLVVQTLIDDHNHESSEISFKSLPNQRMRKITKDIKQKYIEMLNNGANKKLVLMDLSRETNTLVTLRDLSNLCIKSSSQTIIGSKKKAQKKN